MDKIIVLVSTMSAPFALVCVGFFAAIVAVYLIHTIAASSTSSNDIDRYARLEYRVQAMEAQNAKKIGN